MEIGIMREQLVELTLNSIVKNTNSFMEQLLKIAYEAAEKGEWFLRVQIPNHCRTDLIESRLIAEGLSVHFVKTTRTITLSWYNEKRATKP
jgi:hypothetical protein